MDFWRKFAFFPKLAVGLYSFGEKNPNFHPKIRKKT